MTEYELTSTFFEAANAILATWSAFFTITVAFVVAGYLAAHRLARSMLGLVIAFYALSAAVTVFFAHRLSATFAAILLQIRDMAASGRGLAWHPAADVSPALAGTLPTAAVILMPLASIAATYFVLQSRRANAKAEADRAKT